MSKLQIAAGSTTPEVSFHFDLGVFILSGESYPEDVRSFYDAQMKQFYDWLASSGDKPVVLAFKFGYFNSATAKVILDAMTAMEKAAGNGRMCKVQWHYAPHDDNIRDLGEEFGEELSAAKFELVEIKPPAPSAA